MRRSKRLPALLCLVAAGVGGGGCRTDDPAPVAAVARVVSLTPSATEVVGALDATGLLVGVDDYSTFPPAVSALPRVGSFLAPNLEQIVRLRPTLVIVDDVHGAVAGKLGDAGIPTVECAMHGLVDIEHALTTIGDRLGRGERARTVVAGIEATLEATRSHRPAHRPRVLVVIDREAHGLGNLVAAGAGSWVDELLAVTGGENVLAAAGVRYPKISIENVLRAQPDVIVDLSYASGDGGGEPWAAVDVPAVRAHRVVILSPVAYPFLAAPSPRVSEAIAALSRAIAEPPPVR